MAQQVQGVRTLNLVHWDVHQIAFTTLYKADEAPRDLALADPLPQAAADMFPAGHRY